MDICEGVPDCFIKNLLPLRTVIPTQAEATEIQFYGS